MLVGYMRVSTDGDRQVPDLQRDVLLAAGVDERHFHTTRQSPGLITEKFGAAPVGSKRPSPSTTREFCRPAVNSP